MKTNHMIALFVVLWAWDRYNRSHSGVSAIDSAYNVEQNNFAAMEGTNFTNSVWDPVSGQPGYMFGDVPAPGGRAVMGNLDPSGIFGHAAG